MQATIPLITCTIPLITCESDVAAHAEVLERLLLVAREAVDDAVRKSPVPVQLQQVDHLGVRLALVQEQRLLQLARQPDLNKRNLHFHWDLEKKTCVLD